jgi:4-hydroxythreonine-4-phosphate dehydrogenase
LSTKRLALPRVAISLGDPSGIGPEVVAGALSTRRVAGALVPVVFGDASAPSRCPPLAALPRIRAGAPLPEGPAFVVVSRLAKPDRAPGRPTQEGGRAQYAYFEAAIAAARGGQVEALCTAPVSKEQISRAGIPFMGHTEVLAKAFGVEVLMLMDGPRVRVALATNHVPLAQVSRRLTVPRLTRQLTLLSKELGLLLGRPARLGVCGLNPHAGEGGLLGKEEQRVIRPAVARAREAGVVCEGPLPADGLFARADDFPYDGVLAMFHDQGLVAAKALDFERTVNVTLGLPVPRTSPDHGVAYALAGRGEASSVPMAEALLKAAALARARR